MELSREKLIAIKELELDGVLKGMDDNDFNEYCKKLNTYVEKLPVLENELKAHMAEGNMTEFTAVLSKIKELLVNISALDLVKNCDKLLVDIKGARQAVLEAYLSYFLTTASMLSIDIQMAQHQEKPPEEGKPKAEDETFIVTNTEKNILAVDDVSLVLNVLKSALNNTEYKFTGVTSGAAALKYLATHYPDLLILDIEMPGMNGYELAEKIRAMGHTSPIMFLTGNASTDYVVKAIKAGAVDFIVKPVNQEQVLEKIKKHIK